MNELAPIAFLGAVESACRICGFESGESLWDGTGAPTYIICDCCGSESGIHDLTPRAARDARAAWLQRGTPWWDESQRPVEWHLQQIPVGYR